MVIERFATYAGADPRRAPAALAVAGYVEHAWGAWHPRGGLYALVEALVRRLEALGGELRLGHGGAADRAARRPVAARRRWRGGGVGQRARRASRPTRASSPPTRSSPRSTPRRSTATCSAARCARASGRCPGLALMLGLRGRTPGLAHHAITFPADYDAEFDDVFVPPAARCATRRSTSARPCATDPAEAPAGAESWFVLVNAPAIGDGADWDGRGGAADRPARRARPDRRRARCARPATSSARPAASAGAIYGVAPHGRLGTLRRPPATVRGVRGLWLAGGTVHPGGGLPLVLLGAATVAREIGAGMRRASRALRRAAPRVLARPAAARRRRAARRPEERRGDLVYARGGEGPGRVTVDPPGRRRRAAAGRALPARLGRDRAALLPRPGSSTSRARATRSIYPRYQDSFAEPPTQVLGNALVGVRAALERPRRRPGLARRRRPLGGRRARRRLRGGRRARRAAGAARGAEHLPRAARSAASRFGDPAGRAGPGRRRAARPDAARDDRVVDPRDARAIHRRRARPRDRRW